METADEIKRCLATSSHSQCMGEVPPGFAEMCRAATHALQVEDLVVRGALTTGHERFPTGYRDVSRGLAYWVFETGLVYTVFKAWAPKMVTRWEHRYAETGGKAADLVLFPSSEEGWIIEAKWFNSNSNTAQDIVLSDVKKMREANGFPEMVNPLAEAGKPCRWRRFLMTFSWGDSTELDEEWKPFDDFVEQQPGLSLAFVGAFPTHVHRGWGPQEQPQDIETGYFAMTMIEDIDAQ